MAQWVGIIIQEPQCIYYFDSFARANEANLFLGGYIEDLEEGAQVIAIDIKRGQPSKLTILEDELGESFEESYHQISLNFFKLGSANIVFFVGDESLNFASLIKQIYI